MRKIILTLAVAALFVGATGAAAGSLADKEDTITYKIDSAVKSGAIDYDTALMYRFLALSPTGLEHVPAAYRAKYYAEDPVSGTPVYLELMARWPYMRAGLKKKITEVCGVMFGPTPMDGGTRYRNLPGFGVYANYGGFTVYHYDSQDKDGGRDFRIHWVEEGPHAITNKDDFNNNGVPDMIENYARYAETAWNTWHEHHWFGPPPGQSPAEAYLPLKDYYPEIPYPPDEEWDYGGNDRWDIYLGQFTGGVIGMTTGDPFEFPDTYRDDRTPYFMERRNPDASEPGTVAHELNHGVQYMLDVVESSATAVPRWYFEATAMWGEEEVYPGHPDPIGRANNFLGNTLQPLDAPRDQGGYTAVIINYFLRDWSWNHWKAPAWTPREDEWIVRDVWRALAKGDEWYTDDPLVNRESKEAMGYLTQLHRPKYQYITDRIFKDIFEIWTTWNWFTGDRNDGRHYRYGSRFTTITPQNTWGREDLPLVKFKPPEAYYMNHLGHGFYRFNSPPAWPYALITFAGDRNNPDDSKDWAGAVFVTKNGSTWTDLKGNVSQATLMFTPEDMGIIQIPNPGQYQSIVAIISNTSFDGDSLPFEYSYIQTDDTRKPAVAAGLGITQANPDFLEILIGADEEIFGKAEADVYYTSDRTGEKRAEVVPMTAAAGNKNFKGKFILDMGDKGNGSIQWRAADLGGNIVSGGKEFSAGFLASGGGTIGKDKATLKVPAGAIRKPTLFLVAASPEREAVSEVAAAVPANDEGSSVETVGKAYEFSPSWARLAKPFEVALSYEGLDVAREDYLSVFRWTGSSWEDLGGTIDKRNRRVSAVADRLGEFILGYGEKKDTTPPAGKPMSFGLFQNYPNPARDGTVIKFALPTQTEVELVVYDLSGRRVATVLNDVRGAGVYEHRYTLTDDGGKPLPAGVYLYRLSAGSDVATKKLVIAR